MTVAQILTSLSMTIKCNPKEYQDGRKTSELVLTKYLSSPSASNRSLKWIPREEHVQSTYHTSLDSCTFFFFQPAMVCLFSNTEWIFQVLVLSSPESMYPSTRENLWHANPKIITSFFCCLSTSFIHKGSELYTVLRVGSHT